MADTKSTSNTDGPSIKLTLKYVRWGGLAAILGPLLVLSANIYGLWTSRAYEGVVEAATTTPYIVFGGIRLLGGTLLVFGLFALYAYQMEAAGKLGLVGFVGSMVGTVMLTAAAWGELFIVPVLARQVPEFLTAVMAGEAGMLINVGVLAPLLIQAIGWSIFGVSIYRAGIFPRRAGVVLIVGALIMLIPVQGAPVVFQLAVAWLGFLIFSGRVDKPTQETKTDPTPGKAV